MRYPIVIEPGTGNTAYGVVVPDLPGCFSAGDTIDEAMDNAREAIELHLEGLLHDGSDILPPAPIENHRDNPDYAGWTWAMVEIDLAKLHSATKRYNITMPERVMSMVDIAAKDAGESRSGFLAKAAVSWIEGGWEIQQLGSGRINHVNTTSQANDDLELPKRRTLRKVGEHEQQKG